MQPLSDNLATLQGSIANDKLISFSEILKKRKEKFLKKMENLDQLDLIDRKVVIQLDKEDKIRTCGPVVIITGEKLSLTFEMGNNDAAATFKAKFVACQAAPLEDVCGMSVDKESSASEHMSVQNSSGSNKMMVQEADETIDEDIPLDERSSDSSGKMPVDADEPKL